MEHVTQRIIKKEAHETLAIGMNRIRAHHVVASGEDEKRFFNE